MSCLGFTRQLLCLVPFFFILKLRLNACIVKASPSGSAQMFKQC
jgi:hypothetical protein